jgi:short-subunit dehydrogenase
MNYELKKLGVISMVNVKGKWALITGASRGIGYLSAIFMAKQGCNLVLHSRNAQHCQKVADEVKALGVEAYTVEAELSDMEQVEKMCREIDEKGTPIDIILNNAGLQIAYRTEYLATPASDYDISFKVNTTAPMMICYHFLPAMKERGFGRIVNTTSGIDLEPEQAGYSAAKAALNKVTRDLGKNYEGTDITINLTDPGWCRTDLGGQKAPNAPESALPGVLVGAFVDDKKCGRIFSAQEYSGMTLEDAVAKAEMQAGVY